MKKLIIIATVAIALTSCAVQPHPSRNYYSLLEIKQMYELSNRDLRRIVKAAKADSIAIIYHAGRDEWQYDASIDYSKYKSTK